MRPAYVRVELGDTVDEQAPLFTISPVPFLMLYGDDLRPTKAERKVAASYKEICQILLTEFQIPSALLPSAKYFKPNSFERTEGMSYIFRTVPEGFGEPEWRTQARNAIIYALEDADFDKGQIRISDRYCYSMDELQQELEDTAEAAGGRRRIKGESYQPDYDVLVKEVLTKYSTLIGHIGLPRTRKTIR